jgi:hypothetical protein
LVKRVLVASALVAVSLLAACDRKSETPAAAVAAAPVERAGPVTWDAQAGAFKLAGAPLRAVKMWTFRGSTDGFTGLNSKLEPQGDGMLVTIADPSIRTPKGLGVSGAEGNLVLVRLTRVGAGEPWDGGLYYTTANHGEAIEYLGKPIHGAAPKLNETVTLVYDMQNQTIGAPDWTSSTIDQVRFDIEGKPGGKFLIHQVAIVQNPNPAAFAPPAPAAPATAPAAAPAAPNS